MPAPHDSRRGFTIIDLAALLTIGAAAAAFCALSTLSAQPSDWIKKPGKKPPTNSSPAPLSRARESARQLKDATQLRNFIQSMVVFASNNQDVYPLPSLLDLQNHTLAEEGAAKDTTANIFSILIFQGALSTELCVSPAESNPKIKVDRDYQFADPKAAPTPTMALWDPAFSADFTEGNTGNVSYAHLLPSGPRKAAWANTFESLEASAGNRGPEIASATADARGMVTATTASNNSNTYRIHGPKDSWEGNIAYNDGHIEFQTTYGPRVDPSLGKWPTYTNKEGKRTTDILFYDEPDDASRANAFLGIFTKAGAAPSDFKPIWD